MANIAVIGAGAAGLFLVKKLSFHEGLRVYVFEKALRAGAKLRASGGGKANIFNTNIFPEAYNRSDFMRQLLLQAGPDTIRSEFSDMGLAMVEDEEGRVYPSSEFSQTVVDVLLHPAAPDVHWVTGHEVRKVRPADSRWQIDDFPVLFDKVVFASGSPANMVFKNRRGYNAFLKDFNLKLHPYEPSLVGFRIAYADPSLSGCRTKAIVSLYHKGRLVHREKGEVLFKDDGISGIVILNMSAYYHRLPDKNDCELGLDFLYFDANFDVQEYKRRFGGFRGLLHPKLHAFYGRAPFDVKDYRLPVAGLYDLDCAQVCHGGIDLSEVDGQFALKRYPGLFAVGEMLDIDGICGGYNLFFAFASALAVARVLTRPV